MKNKIILVSALVANAIWGGSAEDSVGLKSCFVIADRHNQVNATLTGNEPRDTKVEIKKNFWSSTLLYKNKLESLKNAKLWVGGLFAKGHDLTSSGSHVVATVGFKENVKIFTCNEQPHIFIASMQGCYSQPFTVLIKDTNNKETQIWDYKNGDEQTHAFCPWSAEATEIIVQYNCIHDGNKRTCECNINPDPEYFNAFVFLGQCSQPQNKKVTPMYTYSYPQT